jgi:murein L,D-transpeptidase YafK
MFRVTVKRNSKPAEAIMFRAFLPAALVFLCLVFAFRQAETFKQQQVKNPRVKQAYREKETLLKNLLAAKDIQSFNVELFIRAFKKEKSLEVWVRKKTSAEFILLKTYSICALSGSPGPKRKGGDGQVPEGFYHIDRFNPYSNFFLSLGINYPNESDRKLGHKNPGGDIFIHGDCVTIGCLPIEDEYIKELYLLCVEARSAGQKKIPVHIFPCKINSNAYDGLKGKFQSDPEMINFWKNLEEGFFYFEKNRKLPSVKVNDAGKYVYF